MPILSKDKDYNLNQLALEIKQWGQELGFNQIGITDLTLNNYTQPLANWLEQGYHGTMKYLESNFEKRLDPQQLMPNTQSVICLRMNYPSPSNNNAPIAAFALCQDYPQFIRKLLQQLINKIVSKINYAANFRAFSGSGPLLEKALAAKAGLGWIGKNTLVVNQQDGSFFLLGEIFTSLPLPIDRPQENHCGNCTKCIDACPTKALLAPFKLDARRCISYLTIEHTGEIPKELRPLIGQRIFGCDICQQVCPWNQKKNSGCQSPLIPNSSLQNKILYDFFQWDEVTFKTKTRGTPISRISYQNWHRNLLASSL